MQHVHLRQRGEHFARQVDGGAVASRGVGELTGRLRWRQSHPWRCSHRGWVALSPARWAPGQQALPGQSPDGSRNSASAVQRFVGEMHADGGDHQRVAIARLLGQSQHQCCRRAGLVLDDEGLAQRLCQPSRPACAQWRPWPARWEGHYPANGLAGPGGGRCLGIGCRQGVWTGRRPAGPTSAVSVIMVLSRYGVVAGASENQMAEGAWPGGHVDLHEREQGRPCSSWCSSSLDDTSKMLWLAYSPTTRQMLFQRPSRCRSCGRPFAGLDLAVAWASGEGLGDVHIHTTRSNMVCSLKGSENGRCPSATVGLAGAISTAALAPGPGVRGQSG